MTREKIPHPTPEEMIEHRLKIQAALIRFRLHLTTRAEAEAHALAHAAAKEGTASVFAGT